MSAEPSLKAARLRGESAIRAYVQERVEGGGAFSFGSIDFGGGTMAVWITTPTDAQRDTLRADSALLPRLRWLLLEAGYPEDAVPSVAFAFESDETVARDYEGNWWYRIK